MVVQCHAVYQGTEYLLLPPPLLPAHSAVLCSATQPCFGPMELMQNPGSCWNNVIFSCKCSASHSSTWNVICQGGISYLPLSRRRPGTQLWLLPAAPGSRAEHAAPAAGLCAAPGAVSSTHPWLQLCPLWLPTLGMALGSAPYVSAPYEWESRGSPFHVSAAWLGWKGHHSPPCWHGAEAAALQHGAHPQDLRPWKWLGQGWGLCAGLQARPARCMVICIRSQRSSEQTRIMNEAPCEVPSPCPDVCTWFWW